MCETKILLRRRKLVCADARGCFRHVDDVMVTSLLRRLRVSSCIHPPQLMRRRRLAWKGLTSALISSVPGWRVRVESMLAMHVHAVGGIQAASVRACDKLHALARSLARAGIDLTTRHRRRRTPPPGEGAREDAGRGAGGC